LGNNTGGGERKGGGKGTGLSAKGDLRKAQKGGLVIRKRVVEDQKKGIGWKRRKSGK